MAADDDKKLILARRARFVAAALAGVSVACGKEPSPPPQPCLSQTAEPPDAEPMPCLTPMMREEPDTGAAAPSDGGAFDAGAPRDAGATTTTRSQKPDAGGPTPTPTPCLSPPLPTNTNKPPPQPCLSVIKPKDGTK